MTRTGPLPILTTLVTVLLLAGCLHRRPPNDDIPPRPSPANFARLPSAPGLQVLVLGDWGTGKEGQREVAEAIAVTHGDSPPDFVLTVGDNFYPKGVAGPGDPLWESHFETIYQGPFWVGVVFYPTPGNHDHQGRLEGQIQYSDLSPRWEMPGPYRAFRRSLPGGGSVLLVALDTEPIATGSREPQLQLQWADSVLRNSSADWTVVYGHHPVTTGGLHKVDKTVREALLPLLRDRADLYLSGHNHSTELLETEVGTLQGVCGGGGGLDNPYRVEFVGGTLAAFTNGGWCFVRLWPDTLVVDLYDRGGGLQFRHLIRN